MIIFVTSDKGGTGRSVTSCNIAYRKAVQGTDVGYLDFDFGSPTSGAIFNVDASSRGTTSGAGLHTYLHGQVADPEQVDIWSASDRKDLRTRPIGAGRLILLPGDQNGGEFPIDRETVYRCRDLFLRLEEECDLTLVDLSAGRSQASHMVMRVAALPELRSKPMRWLVFHRWTRQHIIAAAGLVYGDRGLLEVGVGYGLDRDDLQDSIRFVRTAVLDPGSQLLAGLRPPQAAWLQDCNANLQDLAAKRRVGRSVMLGSIPLDPVLQWREQIITERDVANIRIANPETGEAFDNLAKAITDDGAWEGL
jgi:hypothetical protein